MPVKVEVKLDVDSMADFMVYNIYTSGPGMVALILGVLNMGLAVSFIMKGDFLLVLMFLAFAFLILGIFPYLIRRKVAKQMQNSKKLGALVTYEFDDGGITTTTADDSGKASWSKFKRAVARKRIIILYTAEKQAIVLPIDQMGDQYTAVVDLIYANMPAPAVRIRRLDGKK